MTFFHNIKPDDPAFASTPHAKRAEPQFEPRGLSNTTLHDLIATTASEVARLLEPLAERIAHLEARPDRPDASDGEEQRLMRLVRALAGPVRKFVDDRQAAMAQRVVALERVLGIEPGDTEPDYVQRDPAIEAELRRAFDSANARLFGSRLAPIPVELHANERAFGLYKGNKITLHEHIVRYAPKETSLRTLAHEMVHHAVKTESHGDEWRREMTRIGLDPDTTEAIPDGEFEQWLRTWLESQR